MKTSELAGVIATIDTNILAVKESLDKFITAVGTDPDLPPAAADALTKLQGDIATLAADVPASAPTPSPAPGA